LTKRLQKLSQKGFKRNDNSIELSNSLMNQEEEEEEEEEEEVCVCERTLHNITDSQFYILKQLHP
jgi:hypothetical protein